MNVFNALQNNGLEDRWEFLRQVSLTGEVPYEVVDPDAPADPGTLGPLVRLLRGGSDASVRILANIPADIWDKHCGIHPPDGTATGSRTAWTVVPRTPSRRSTALVVARSALFSILFHTTRTTRTHGLCYLSLHLCLSGAHA